MAGLSNASVADLAALLFQNTSWANVGNAGGVLQSTVAGSFYISLHTADPGNAGSQTTNECSYTGYARVAVARSSAGFTIASQVVSNTATITFGSNTGSSQTATHFAIGRDSSGAGEIICSGNLGGGMFEFTANDAAGDTITIVGASYAVNDTVCMYARPNAALPTGVTEGTIYFIKTASTNSYTLSATSGGATLDITAVGSGLISRVNTSSSAGYVIGTSATPSFAASALTAALR